MLTCNSVLDSLKERSKGPWAIAGYHVQIDALAISNLAIFHDPVTAAEELRAGALSWVHPVVATFWILIFQKVDEPHHSRAAPLRIIKHDAFLAGGIGESVASTRQLFLYPLTAGPALVFAKFGIIDLAIERAAAWAQMPV